MGLVESDRKVAEGLALEVRTASGGPRTWRRVASLLEAFGVERLSDDVRERIAAALTDVRIEVDPPLNRVQRDQLVRLALPDSDTVWAEAARHDGRRLRPAISGTAWRGRAASAELNLEEPRPEAATVWFDVDAAASSPDEVVDELWPYCRNELTREMAEDLLEGAGRPGVTGYGGDGRVRLVSVFGLGTHENATGGSNGTASKAGALVFRPVRLLAGSDWMVSCWHAEADEAAFNEAVATARTRLEAFDQPPTPGDLAINVVYSVTCTYPATERRLHSWLDAWELDFHKHLEGHAGRSLATLEKATLIDLRGLLAELRSRLHGFEQPGRDPAEAWFTDLRDRETAMRVRQVVTATLAELGELDDALRTSLDLLVTTSAAEQLAAARSQAAQGERINRQLALITSVLLVPTFLAELFGTKPYPGDEGLLEFGFLLVAMVVLATTTYRLLMRRGS